MARSGLTFVVHNATARGQQYVVLQLAFTTNGLADQSFQFRIGERVSFLSSEDVSTLFSINIDSAMLTLAARPEGAAGYFANEFCHAPILGKPGRAHKWTNVSDVAVWFLLTENSGGRNHFAVYLLDNYSVDLIYRPKLCPIRIYLALLALALATGLAEDHMHAVGREPFSRHRFGHALALRRIFNFKRQRVGRSYPARFRCLMHGSLGIAYVFCRATGHGLAF